MAVATRRKVVARKMRKKVQKGQLSLLIQAIEAGGSVKGMVGYVELQDPSERAESVFVKVKATGIKAEGCGMQIHVRLMSGLGDMEISPCQWLDGPADIEAKREFQGRQEKAKAELKKLNGPHYAAAKRDALVEYVASHMDKDGQKAFYGHMKETIGTDKFNSALSAATVKSLAKTAVLVVNDLTEAAMDSDYDFRNS